MSLQDNRDYIPSLLKSDPSNQRTSDNPESRNFKYEISQHSYPIDLLSKDNQGNSPYGGNYVIFYINVPIESKILKNPEVKTVPDVTRKQRGIAAGGEYQDTKVLPAIVSGSAVAGVVGSIGGSGVGQAVGITTVVGAAGIALDAGTFTREQKRLQTAIALHVPNQLNIRYGANYSDEDTAAFSAIARVSEETAKVLGRSAARVVEAVSSGNIPSEDVGLRQLGSTASAVAAAIGYSSVFGGDALSAATGTQANPKKEQVFRGVDFRTFSMDYQFFPRSPEESRNVLNIIKEFKFHMHPEFKDDTSFLFLYPSEFDISYYTNGTENKSLHRHTSCVLTELNINYTPNGTFNTFPDGTPTQINIVMTFKELAILVKDRIEEGY